MSELPEPYTPTIHAPNKIPLAQKTKLKAEQQKLHAQKKVEKPVEELCVGVEGRNGEKCQTLHHCLDPKIT